MPNFKTIWNCKTKLLKAEKKIRTKWKVEQKVEQKRLDKGEKKENISKIVKKHIRGSERMFTLK